MRIISISHPFPHSLANSLINGTLRMLRHQDHIVSLASIGPSEVGIYKRKEESKKTRKQGLDQESDREKKKTRTRPRKRSRKQENKKVNKNSTKKENLKKKSFFLDRFLGRVLVFLFSLFLL